MTDRSLDDDGEVESGSDLDDVRQTRARPPHRHHLSRARPELFRPGICGDEVRAISTILNPNHIVFGDLAQSALH